MKRKRTKGKGASMVKSLEKKYIKACKILIYGEGRKGKIHVIKVENLIMLLQPWKFRLDLIFGWWCKLGVTPA